MEWKDGLIGHILRHDGLLHEIIESRMRGIPTRERRRIRMLHDFANYDGHVALKQAAEFREGWRHRESRTLPNSLRFNGHFSGKPGLAGSRLSPFWILLELMLTEVVVTTAAIRHAKLQSNCHHQQTIAHLFYRPDALAVTQPTVSEH